MNQLDELIAMVQGSPIITDFQRRVYLELLNIPQGQTITYKSLGERISCRSAQAIGQALRRNPFGVGCPILPEYGLSTSLTHFDIDCCIPCHRVISSAGTIGGFCGQREGDQIDRKRRLLQMEGVKIKGLK